MPDATLSGFTDRSINRQAASISVDVVISPWAPALQFAPALQDVTSMGVNGYRSRLIFEQPRPFRFLGMIGATTATAAFFISQQLQNIEGTIGQIEFTQGGLTKRFTDAQVRNLRAQHQVGKLGTPSTLYDFHVVVEFDCFAQGVGT